MASISTASNTQPRPFPALLQTLTTLSSQCQTLHHRVPHDPSTTDAIASLHVHPSLEALLHILNADLSSAHFLVRHMQTAPQLEAMYAHGILHRIEGDFDNARAWYGNVCGAECFTAFWGPDKEAETETGMDGQADGARLRRDEDGNWIDDAHGGRKVPVQIRARQFLNALETAGKTKTKKTMSSHHEHDENEDTITGDFRDEKDLLKTSHDEIMALIKFCADKYGTDVWMDASSEWCQPETGSVADKKKDMLTGPGGGHRHF